MDFENLYTILPKYPQTWSIKDVSTWLHFINLEKYVQSFQLAAVDGSCINLIDNSILEHQLGIGSAIIRKKLINWMQNGLQKYSLYLNSLVKMQEQFQLMPILNKTETSYVRNNLKPSTSYTDSCLNEMQEEYQDQMIIQAFEGNNLGTHIVKQNQIITIGFDKQNDIQSLETTFSNQHALIGHNGTNHYIQDLGSKHGTYLKITHRTQLEIGTLLQIGSYQFQVIKANKRTLDIVLKCLVGTLQDEQQKQNKQDYPLRHKIFPKSNQLRINLKQIGKFTFGRRKQNDFHRNDKHMSGIHCKIVSINRKFYIEDFGSTNGTWIRISKSHQKSDQFLIKNQTIIKIGTTVTYLCRKKQRTQKQIVEVVCRNCNQQQNNCLFYPCSHNVFCFTCSSDINICPQCNQTIQQRIKIHK